MIPRECKFEIKIHYGKCFNLREWVESQPEPPTIIAAMREFGKSAEEMLQLADEHGISRKYTNVTLGKSWIENDGDTRHTAWKISHEPSDIVLFVPSKEEIKRIDQLWSE